jgi:hypothetical protein
MCPFIGWLRFWRLILFYVLLLLVLWFPALLEPEVHALLVSWS